MQTGRWTCRRSRSSAGRRLATAILPLLGLLTPTAATAEEGVAISVCGGNGERLVTIPGQQGPERRRDDQQGGCAHFVCPRERAQGGPADEDEE